MACQSEKQPKLKVPYYPEKDDDKGHYEAYTREEKTVVDYTGYSFDRINDLNVFEYWLLLRDAVIYNCQQTKEGREYLEKCWLNDQTEPDRAMLLKLFKKN